MKLLQSKSLSTKEINVEQTINSGQVFLWEKFDNVWYGVDGHNIIKISQQPFVIESFNNENKFFRFNDDLEKIFSQISNDKIVKKAIKKSPGLKLLRQDPFQCYISFIVSSNSNIQNIRNALQKICKRFGKKISFQGKEFFLFPSPDQLANAKITELIKCGLGYRAKFVREASKNVVNEKINFEFLKNLDYHTAKNRLMENFGIGNKVADCILLFSLDKLEAFPLDRWMLRILEKYYPNNFSFEGKTLTQKKYDMMHEKIIDHFGPYAGYAQQFLFKMERDLNQKKWL